MLRTDINFRESAQFLALIIILLVASQGVIWGLPLVFGWRFLLALLTLGYVMYITGSVGLRQGQRTIRGLRQDDASWWLLTARGWRRADLCGDSTVTLFASVLRFNALDGSGKYRALVFRDMLPKDVYRQLIVQIRANTALRAEHVRRRASLARSLEV